MEEKSHISENTNSLQREIRGMRLNVNGRLGFIKKTILACGITNTQELAERMNITPQCIYMLFKRDDCRLSVAEDFIRTCGGELKVELHRNEETTKQNLIFQKNLNDYDGVNNSVQGNLFVEPELRFPKTLINCSENNRLYFLAQFFIENKIDHKALQNALEVNRSYFYTTFKADNIHISTLFNIAKIYNCSITWIVDKI